MSDLIHEAEVASDAGTEQAETNLGFPVGPWRIREAWSAGVIRGLQDRYLAWREREASAAAVERVRQAAKTQALLQRMRDQHAGVLQQINARLALLDGGDQ